MFVEKVAAALVFSIPYLIVVSGYYWLIRKIMNAPGTPWKFVAMIIWLFGCGYTVFTFAKTVHEIFSPMNFDLVLIAINCFIMLLVAVALVPGKTDHDGSVRK